MFAITLQFHNVILFSIQLRRLRCFGPSPHQPMSPRPRPPHNRAPSPPYIEEDEDECRMMAWRDTGNGEDGDQSAGDRHMNARLVKSRRGAPGEVSTQSLFNRNGIKTGDTSR